VDSCAVVPVSSGKDIAGKVFAAIEIPPGAVASNGNDSEVSDAADNENKPVVLFN